MPHCNKLLDSTQINNLRELFNDGFYDYLNVYFEDFEQKENQIETALQNKKIELIVKIAHSLKSNSLSLGACELARACYQLEMAGMTGDYQNMIKQYSLLQKNYAETKKYFLAFILN